jgi:hypothetical protein
MKKKYSFSVGLRKALFVFLYTVLVGVVDVVVKEAANVPEFVQNAFYPVAVSGLVILGNFLRFKRKQAEGN